MVKRSVIALVAAGSILLVALACSSNIKANSNQWGVVWNEEFKGTSVPSGWDVLQQNRDNYGGNHLAYNPSNVKVVDNDYLEIKTQRHCVANLDEPLNDSNVSEAPCPSGKMTRYLSGRVTNKTKVVDGTKPFRAEIRAKFNWNGKNGTRPSLWMVNGNSLQNCHHNPNANDPYGELDIIEWYSYTPAYTWSSTHATCYHHGVSGNWKNGWRTRRIIHSDEHKAGSKSGSLAYEWHTWAVEYDGETVKYFIDDKPITAYNYHASPTNHKDIERTPSVKLTTLADKELIKQTFDAGWRFILNDYVEKDEEQKPISPSDTFPKQTMLIDYVRVFQRGAGTQPAEIPAAGTGAEWSKREAAGSRMWTSIASSSDGNKLAAVYDWGGYIYTSSNAGATWTARGVPGSYNWTAVASSADGNKLVATAKDHSIYTSTDAGATWTERKSSGSRKWSSVASSSDGNKLVATATGGNIYTSTDAGATWTEHAADGLHNWTSATISDDGSKISATAGGGGYIFSSSDSGATWVAQASAGVPNWSAITGSTDGTKLAAVSYGGNIYTTTRAYEQGKHVNPSNPNPSNPGSSSSSSNSSASSSNNKARAANNGSQLADTGASIVAVTLVAVLAVGTGAGAWLIRKKM